jgi:hypothetical protein
LAERSRLLATSGEHDEIDFGKGESMENGLVMIESMPWFAWVAIAGIAGGTFSTIFKMGIVHRERMAMIRMGINPDAPHAKPYEPEHSEV